MCKTNFKDFKEICAYCLRNLYCFCGIDCFSVEYFVFKAEVINLY